MSEFTIFAKWARNQDPNKINWEQVKSDYPDYNVDLLMSDFGIGVKEPESLMSFTPEPVSSLVTPGTRQKQLPIVSADKKPVSGIEDLMLKIPRIPKRVVGVSEVERVLLNLGIGGAEMTANTPAFLLDMAAKTTAAPFSKEARDALAGMPRQILEPISKLWGNILGLESEKFQYTPEQIEELKQHPEILAVPVLMAAGGPKAVRSVARAGRAIRTKIGAKIPVELRDITKIKVEPKAPKVKVEPKAKEPVISDIDISVRKVTEALKEAKPVRKTQEALYTKERGARLAKLKAVRKTTTGEKGFYAELGQLKGELPKATFESIRKKVSQTDIDNLFNKVRDADVLTDWEKITAREGLAKMFSEYGGRVPTRGELTLLDQVFPVDLLEAIMAKRPLWTKAKEAGLQLANIPRSVMASFDLSFGLRQGAFAAPKFRKEFWSSWKKQFKIFGSEKAYRASREALIADKDFKFAKESKIAFTEMGKIMAQREEVFAAQWAEKIPVAGKGVRASGRAYTSFANKYRLDIFKKLVEDAEKSGLNPRDNPYQARSIADFVNNATGRGSLGSFEGAALALNALFFSPRLNMARLRLLNPAYYIKQPKHIRKQAISTALHAAGTATTILTLAKLGGADVTADPRNADFGKIKIRNTRMDMLVGFGQFIRGAAQISTGQYISSSTGKKFTLGEGYRPLTRMDVLIRQIESKEAPVMSFITELLRDKNWEGEDFNAIKAAGSRFVPMVWSDIIDIAKEDPKLLGLGVPAVFGVGLMTYKKRGLKYPGR